MEPFDAAAAPRQTAWARPPTRFTIFGGLFGLFLLQYAVGVFSPQLRDLRYLLPPLALVLVMFTGVRLTAERRAALFYLVRVGLLLAAMILVSLGAQFMQWHVYYRFLKDSYFLMGPILFILVMICYVPPKNLDKYVDWAFYVLILTFIIIVKGNLIVSLANPIQLVFGLVTSKVLTETPHSLYFGMFTLYYLFAGRKKYSLLAFLLLVLSFKRMAILGTVGALFTIGILKLIRIKLPRNRNLIAVLATALNIFLIFFIYLIAQGVFDPFLQGTIGMTTNMLMKGRQAGFAEVFASVGTIPMLGVGVGATTVIIVESGLSMNMAHSDLLKLFMEFGPILTIVYVAFMYRLYGRNYGTLALMIYMNVLFLAGSTLIYFSVMAFHYFLVSIVFIKSIE